MARGQGLTVAFHWREAPDDEAARRTLEAVAERRARRPGSSRAGAGRCSSCGRRSTPTRAPRCGRCSPSAASSGRCTRATTRTDLDAFRGLDGLELSIRVAVSSAEGPPELREAADLVVSSPVELLELLRTL